MNLIRVTPDRKKARSILATVLLIEKRLKETNRDEYAPLIISDYYEIIKELLTALLCLKGLKTLSHTELIDFAAQAEIFSSREFMVMDSLRKQRNWISYNGGQVEVNYLRRNEAEYNRIIGKLRNLVISMI